MNRYNEVYYNETVYNTLNRIGRILKVVAFTSQYRKVKAFNSQYRVVKLFTAAYRKVKAFNSGGG